MYTCHFPTRQKICDDHLIIELLEAEVTKAQRTAAETRKEIKS